MYISEHGRKIIVLCKALSVITEVRSFSGGKCSNLDSLPPVVEPSAKPIRVPFRTRHVSLLESVIEFATSLLP